MRMLLVHASIDSQITFVLILVNDLHSATSKNYHIEKILLLSDRLLSADLHLFQLINQEKTRCLFCPVKVCPNYYFFPIITWLLALKDL